MPGGLTWPEQASPPSQSDGVVDGAVSGAAHGASSSGAVSGSAHGASGSAVSGAAYEASDGGAVSGAANGASDSIDGASAAAAAAAADADIARISAEASGMPIMGDVAGLPAQVGGNNADGQSRQPVRPLLNELRSGPFRLSAVERRLWKDDVEIVLTPTEWTLVKLLLEREGAGLSRDDILDEVWGRHFIGDLKIVDVNIRRIRTKIEDEPSEPKYIETLWGYGYRWKRSAGQ
ncbi:winged helix-turn-helix domain-containing protein [Paenibacillus oenotherae]|uniref:Winged helix-turn-helix domain-containing protein n=2 Tax=Paenibacillus oenotherae TaxID=1435645 RepID=A0ABS7D5M0_9BACL|nr:winged helix-turn-helix domain-containing protein [Paenibacillus oenotherae]